MSTTMIYATESRFREVFNVMEEYIERRYSVRVAIGDIADPFTGDLDGESIEIDYDQSCEDALFIMAHLLGHTVQWNTDPRAREIGMTPVTAATEAFLEDLAAYERQACRYSLQLFHDAGVLDLDQWMSDFAGCDSTYLLHFYRTGTKLPFRSFWREGTPRIEPLSIPRFQPTRWLARSAGVVV